MTQYFSSKLYCRFKIYRRFSPYTLPIGVFIFIIYSNCCFSMFIALNYPLHVIMYTSVSSLFKCCRFSLDVVFDIYCCVLIFCCLYSLSALLIHLEFQTILVMLLISTYYCVFISGTFVVLKYCRFPHCLSAYPGPI